MFKYLLLVSFLFLSLSTQAKTSCLMLFERESSIEILNIINEKYSQKLFNSSVDENIQQSSFISRGYKLFKLKRLFRNLEKNGSGFDGFELATFVYRLDKLAFADAVEKNLSRTEKTVLSEARRSVMSEGIIRHFELDKARSGFFKKFGVYFSVASSWKYWRWSFAWMGMPKLVGTALPPELAHKILLEGLDQHRTEVEKYLPQLRSRSFFNTFSKVYNIALVTSLFTVVPYLTHDFYQEQMKIGQENALQVFAPLMQTTTDMAKVDQQMQREIGALEKYVEAYRQKYSAEPTPEQIEAAQLAIRKKMSAG